MHLRHYPIYNRHWLPALSHIAPPHIRRLKALKREAENITNNPTMPVHEEFCRPTARRPCATAGSLSSFNISDRWIAEWSASAARSCCISDPTKKPKGFDLPRKIWCRLRTGHGRCNSATQMEVDGFPTLRMQNADHLAYLPTLPTPLLLHSWACWGPEDRDTWLGCLAWQPQGYTLNALISLWYEMKSLYWSIPRAVPYKRILFPVLRLFFSSFKASD